MRVCICVYVCVCQPETATSVTFNGYECTHTHNAGAHALKHTDTKHLKTHHEIMITIHSLGSCTHNAPVHAPQYTYISGPQLGFTPQFSTVHHSFPTLGLPTNVVSSDVEMGPLINS